MAIITISRGCYSHGKEVAERLAERLNYECISREVLLEASEEFNIPEIKLERAIHDAPSILESFFYGKEKYVAYIRSALLNHIRKDNVVYHGLAGHFFVQNIQHVLHVRIIADSEDRIKEEMKRENISYDRARNMISKDDAERRKWSQNLYFTDPWDPNFYDVILQIKTLSVDDAVDIICESVKKSCFKTTPESQKALDEVALAAKIEALLVEHYPKPCVNVKGRAINIHIQTSKKHDKVVSEIKKVVGENQGYMVEVQTDPPVSTAPWGRL
ncbi:MAG: cytidylate kinase-like family protein [Desulfobacteraceae bacterium]|nr:cytidylate kinase-like family protein [Desulfobacteraceae bacterium]